MAKDQLKVTSINTLKGYMKGSVVKLPSFGDGQDFVARLKRPSLLDMMRTGQIPNELLSSASDLFAEGTSSFVSDKDNMSKLYDVMDKLCEATFVEPSYDEMKEAGVKLTDEQLIFIFDYSQNGVKALDSFRQEQRDIVDDTIEQALSDTTE